MAVGLYDARPPFVRFEERELGINPEASAISGRPIPRIVNMVCITPHGSKDCIEKIAEEWLEQQKQKALRGEVQVAWLDTWKLQFEEWKKGHEMPRDGTPTKTWPAITKEQQVRLLALGYTTVEDLAMVPDSSLGTIGLDGRNLRDLARNWISEGKDKGINAKKLADAETRIADLEQMNADYRQRLAALENQMATGEAKRGPGRPRKEESQAAQ